MPFLDKISDLAGRFAPSNSSKFMTGGIGGGHGMVPIDDDVSDCVISDSSPSYASSGGCPFQLRNRIKLNFAASDGQSKRRAAPNPLHHSCVMAVMALGSFNFLPLVPTSFYAY
jgi:hypothetical protein